MWIKKMAAAVMAGVMFISTGCSLQRETGEYENSIFVLEDADVPMPALVFMEEKPVIAYIKPAGTPNVIVDRYGYAGASGLTAYIRGTSLPDLVYVKEKQSHETVYQGKLQNISYDEGEGIYYGEFSFRIPEEGTYYIQCDHLGMSYPFRVENGLYGNLTEELFQQIMTASEKDSKAAELLLPLVIAWEWQPEGFDQRDDNNVPEALSYIADWIRGNDFTDMDENKKYLFAAFLAKFSYLYREYDLAYATECLHMASTIFSKVQDSKKKSADQFFALTELYRATGLAAYGNKILDYKAVVQEQKGFLEESSYLYGTMTYFLTRQSVDTDFCNFLMQKLLQCGEEAAGECIKMVDSLQMTGAESKKLLYLVRQLNCANYVLESVQYVNIMADVMHYLMGRNAESFVYYNGVDEVGEYYGLAAALSAYYTKEIN